MHDNYIKQKDELKRGWNFKMVVTVPTGNIDSCQSVYGYLQRLKKHFTRRKDENIIHAVLKHFIGQTRDIFIQTALKHFIECLLFSRKGFPP